MNEATLKAKVSAALRARGAWVYKTHGGPFARVGVPDLLVCYEGRFIGIELKAPGKKVVAGGPQERELAAIVRAGGVAVVATSVEEAVAALGETSLTESRANAKETR